jgi:hypothetical protein
MKRTATLCVMLMGISDGVWAQTGTTDRFQADTLREAAHGGAL